MDCSLPGSSVQGDSPGKRLEWVAMPSSGGSSRSRHRTQVSRIVGRFFATWAIREALSYRGAVLQHCGCSPQPVAASVTAGGGPAQPLVGTALGPPPAASCQGGTVSGSIQPAVGAVVVLRERGSEVKEGSWPSPGGSPVHRASGQQVSWGAGAGWGRCPAGLQSPRRGLPPTGLRPVRRPWTSLSCPSISAAWWWWPLCMGRSLRTWSPPPQRPEEPEGCWVLGTWLLRGWQLGRVWGLAPREPPAETCLLARTRTSEGRFIPRDLTLSCPEDDSPFLICFLLKE